MQHYQHHSNGQSRLGRRSTVRYAIDDELWESFTIEQVTKQIGRLRETGGFWAPNDGGPFVVRVSYYALMGDLDVSNNTDHLLEISPVIVSSRDRDILDKQGPRTIPNTQNSERFFDFSFDR